MGVRFEHLGKQLGNLNKVKVSTPKPAFGQDANLTIANASFSGKSFNVSSETTLSQSVTFNNTGSRMFVVGFEEVVYQYDLTTPFEVPTASLSGSFDVNANVSQAEDVQFNNTGTRMFVIGWSSSQVIQYDLTTPFDITTASSAAGNFNISQDSLPRSVAFNSTGTRLFVAGDSSDVIYQYDLTTGFDITTASYNGDSFNVGGSPHDAIFNSVGTRLFVAQRDADSIEQYNLTIGFDINTASFSGISFNINSEETFLQGIAFNTTGTLMYVIGRDFNTVYQYDL